MANYPAKAVEAEACEANDAEADEADEAIVVDEIEANVINEIAAADKVIVIDKPAEAEEAEADEANEAKANEANAKADVANELTSEWGRRANKAVEAEVADANEADDADLVDEAIEIVEIDSANEDITIDRAIAVDRANTDICRSLLIDGIAIVLYLVSSLTKYSIIFTEVEGDFEKNNNQLGTVEITRSVKIWSKSCSLRMWCNNKLEMTLNFRSWLNAAWLMMVGSMMWNGIR